MDNSFDSLLNASAVPQDEKVQAFIAESKNVIDIALRKGYRVPLIDILPIMHF